VKLIVRAGIWAACGIASFAPRVRAQSNDNRPRFEVASVKRNLSGCPQGRGGAGAPDPGRLHATCTTVKDLIQAAYGTFANGPAPDPRMLQVLGAPDWIDAEMFDLDAKPAGPASIDQIYGPMLQTLLEERFSLRIHRETRELPVYLLSVDPAGAKLRASAPGSCVQFDPSNPPPQPVRGQPPVSLCGRTSIKRAGRTLTIDAFGVSMAKFAGVTLSARAELDRPVLDRTRLEGIFDVHLAFTPDPATAPPGSETPGDAGPSIFTGLRDLGLRLSPGKGPVEVLIVDGVSHPAEN
jgi:uncharacterized protein (TIGR03435 family)